MIIKHIDNSFYKLSAAQARELVIEGALPRHGYARRADPEKLAGTYLTVDGSRVWRCDPKAQELGILAHMNTDIVWPQQAWIQRTRLSWWEGKVVEEGWVWAIHLYFSVM